MRASGVDYGLRVATVFVVLAGSGASDESSPGNQAPKKSIGCSKGQPQG